mmetsp:Transcript_51469/g.70118  ORF Transcript_51469/g.70118 Transcript_51469/m.70118 type:complete len:106 (-) Transcript_51469:507-824(-)
MDGCTRWSERDHHPPAQRFTPQNIQNSGNKNERIPAPIIIIIVVSKPPFDLEGPTYYVSVSDLFSLFDLEGPADSDASFSSQTPAFQTIAPLNPLNSFAWDSTDL